MYREDTHRSWPEDTAVFAVDLQKVLLLPRTPDYKKCIFTSRLVVFNETFASVLKEDNPEENIISHCGIRAYQVAVVQILPVLFTK